MAEVKWIKMSTDLFNNKKIHAIEAMPNGDSIIVVWLKLLVLAGNCNENGVVYFTRDIPYTDQLLANEFGRPLSTVQLALQTFQLYGMIDIVDNFIHVTNWEKYQNTGKLSELREYNRLAQQKSRAKRKLLLSDVNDLSMTSQPCHDTDKEEDKDKDIDIEIEKEKEIEKNTTKKDLRSDERGGVSSSSSFSYEDFEKFYKAYPKHKSRATAETAFFKIKGVDLNVILKAVEEQKKTDQWQKQGGQFVPYPATWLNSRGWENEVKPNEYANGQVPAGTVFKEYPPDSGNMLPAEIVATFRSRELQCADDERVPYKNFSIPKGVLELYQQAITMGKKGG